MATPYPPGPAHVPAGLADAPPQYRNRAYLAVAALALFVALYVALTAWFAYKGFSLLSDSWSASGSNHAFLGTIVGLLCAFLAVFLGKALIFIRRDRPGGLIELGANETELREFIRHVADEAGAPRPHRIYLSAEVNAAVFYDLSLLNLLWPSRKNLVIGLGLVNVLTRSEFKAVLGHEFGHFAQRSMAVGRWIYTGQKIAAHIVSKRDVLDRMLIGLSQFDIRIAWIGWIMRIIVWSVRSTMDQVFRGVALAERALSRQMELQADLVAVTISGSDALVHALHKLRTADDAWDQALSISARERANERIVADLFAMQDRVLHHYRETLGDVGQAELPPLPAEGREQHRVFQASLGQPPQMWSTHPPSHIREQNVKKVYVPCEFDERPAWGLFADPEALRAQLTEHVLEPGPQMLRMDLEMSVSKIDDHYDHRFFDRRYRGLYLGRRVTRSQARPLDLVGETPTDPAGAIAALYPAEWTAAVTRWRDLVREHAQLDALERGLLEAPGGIIQFRGQGLRRRELRQTVAQVASELETARTQLDEHDRSVRTAHLAAAHVLGEGWPEYLWSLIQLLHYAEHVEANVDDAHATLMNVVEVVLADGRVSSRERTRVLAACNDLQFSLERVYGARTQVEVPPRVLQRLGVGSWSQALPDEFHLGAPHDENLGDWLEIEGGWFSVISNPLGELRHDTLETLLEAEAHIADCFAKGQHPGSAPAPATVPLNYTTMCHGGERDKQLRLDLWDRFVLAEGWGPGLARMAVAGSIVAAVLSVSSVTATPTVVVYNGLSRAIEVKIGGSEETIGSNRSGKMEFELTEGLVVEAWTQQGELIERFSPTIENAMIDQIYNVGGATPLIEWIALYGAGNERPPQRLGAPRWTRSTADDLFRDPPEEVKTREGMTATRRVLTALDLDGESGQREYVSDEEWAAMVAFHVRWEPGEVLVQWVDAADDPSALSDALTTRLEGETFDVELGRLIQDYGDREHACAVHTERAAERPDDPDTEYLAVRCIDDETARDVAMMVGHEQHPRHPYFANAAGSVFAGRGETQSALQAYEVAMRGLRDTPMAFGIALESARLRRWASGVDADVTDLGAYSERFGSLMAAQNTDEGQAYVNLTQGDLTVAEAPHRPDVERLIRLVGASDGASAEQVQRALELPFNDDLDVAVVLLSIALANREGTDASAFEELAYTRLEEQAEDLLAFTRREAIAGPEHGAGYLEGMSAISRGYALAAGLVTLGDEAPPHWRTDVERLLLSFERPYFATAAAKSLAEVVEAG
ncbi:MAG: M48 family metallopeptidase [Myxococcota bacterium]